MEEMMMRLPPPPTTDPEFVFLIGMTYHGDAHPHRVAAKFSDGTTCDMMSTPEVMAAWDGWNVAGGGRLVTKAEYLAGKLTPRPTE